MARRADEKVRIGADTTEAERGFSKLSSIGKAAVIAIATAAAAAAVKMASSMVSVFREQEQAETRLRRALVTSGKYTADYEKRLHDVAQRIQRTTNTGDEAAMNMIAQFTAVGRVGQDSIEAATQAAIGYAELTKRSPVRVTRTWAGALADIAIEGRDSLGELERLFSSAEIEMLRALKATEGGIAAQARAIDLLNQRYGEHAKSVEGSTDVYVQLGNLWGDFKEELGRIVHLLVGPITRWIKEQLPAWIAGIQDVYVEIATLGSGWELMVADMKFHLADADVEWRKWLHGLLTGQDVFGENWEERWKKQLARMLYHVAVFGVQMADWIPGMGAPGKPLPPLGAGGGGGDLVSAARERRDILLGERNLAALRHQDARARAREGMRGGGARTDTGAIPPGGGGGDGAGTGGGGADQLRALQDRGRVLQATLRGMSDAWIAYYTESLRIKREGEAALKLIDDEATRALGEQTLHNLEIERTLNDEKLAAAKLAAEAAVEEDLARMREDGVRMREALVLERDIERQLNIELDQADREYLVENLRTKEQIERDARQQEMEAFLADREELMRLENEYGKEGARIRRFFASAEVAGAISLYQALAQVATGGNKKLLKLVKVAEAARAVMLSKVKPAQAYAETSSKYPWPLGPILGAVHAASVYAPLIGAIASLGEGGGGGGPAIRGARPNPAPREIDEFRPSPIPDRRAEERRIIVEVPVTLDGRNIAQVIAEHVALAENE